MKTELTPMDRSLLQRIGGDHGTTWISKSVSAMRLMLFGLIYRPESGYARITEAGKELLAKMKG